MMPTASLPIPSRTFETAATAWLRVAMSDVQDQHVGPGLDQGSGPVEVVPRTPIAAPTAR